MIDTCNENIIAMYHITADDRVMGSVSGAKKLLQTVQNSKYITKDEEEINRIYVSLICPNSDKVIDPDSYAAQLVETSGGVIYTAAERETETPQAAKKVRALRTADVTDSEDEKPLITKGSFAGIVRDNVTGILGEGSGNEYKVITSTGLTTIKLDKPLTKDSTTDTDHDDRSDWEEVNTDLVIKIYADKHYGDITIVDGKWRMPTYLLPTYEEIIQNYNELFYVKGGLEKWLVNSSYGGNPYLRISNVKILPIFSNPVDADSDNDSIPDYCDNNKLYPHNIAHDLKTDSGEKYVDTFEILKNLNSPAKVSKKINCKVDVYSLPNSSSKKLYRYGDDITDISVYSVVKSEDCYWLKIRFDKSSGKFGYIKWDESSLGDINHSINNIIDKFGIYHINLPLNILYESGIGYRDQHIFKKNPEYQGFLMALSDTYDNLNRYREKGYPFSGFILIGMSFGESNAGLDTDNCFGATYNWKVNEKENDKILMDIGENIVVSTMQKCNLAFSSKDALDLLNTEIYYQKAQGMIAFLQRRINEETYDITSNYTSYCLAVANALDWENNHLMGIKEPQKYLFIRYKKKDIIDRIGQELADKCEFIVDPILYKE